MTQDALEYREIGQPGTVISPLLELGAYELLWTQQGMSFKRLADLFRDNPNVLPSQLVDQRSAVEMAQHIVAHLSEREIQQFGVRVHRGGEYPRKLRDARHPVELLYYRGIWEYVETPCVAVVGTRHPSDEGRRRTRKLCKMLASDGWTIVSGLATGVDTEAHQTALAMGKPTIAVIGTPICEVYPAENTELQEQLARHYLVISQVPIERYHLGNPHTNRWFFPERNITMSALTAATIIVEAGNTSGTLIQARHALQQKRQLFVLESCFQNPELTWPHEFAKRGAIRVSDFEQIRDVLVAPDKDR